MNESGTTQEKERTLQAAELHREYGNIDQALDAMISTTLGSTRPFEIAAAEN